MDLDHAGQVVGVEVGGETKNGVVRHGDHVILVLETEERREGAKGFFGRDLHIGGRVTHDRRQEELTTQRASLTTRKNLAALSQRIREVFAHFFDRFRFDQRAKVGASLKAVANLQCFDRSFEFRAEFVVDAVLHVDAVCTDAGLPVVAEFTGDSALNGCVDVCVVKHDERCVAAQLHRTFHHVVRGLTQQDTAHLGRACEGQFAHLEVFAELFADARCVLGRDNAKDAFGNASLFRKNRHGERGQRGLRSGTDDERTARRQRRSHLAGDHRIGEVPRGDTSSNANRLFDHGDAFVGHVTGDGFAVDAFGFFTEPFHKGRAIGDLATSLSQWFALFGSHDDGEVLLVLHHQVEPFAQDLCPFFTRFRGP